MQAQPDPRQAITPHIHMITLRHHGHTTAKRPLKPEDLGLRITGFLATGPVTETSVPDDYCDVAVPFA